MAHVRISQLYATRRPVFSFEFFPPRTDAGYRALYRTIEELKRLDPGFVSVTCHSAGQNRTKTAELVIRIQRELGLTTVHVTHNPEEAAPYASRSMSLRQGKIVS